MSSMDPMAVECGRCIRLTATATTRMMPTPIRTIFIGGNFLAGVENSSPMLKGICGDGASAGASGAGGGDDEDGVSSDMKVGNDSTRWGGFAIAPSCLLKAPLDCPPSYFLFN